MSAIIHINFRFSGLRVASKQSSYAVHAILVMLLPLGYVRFERIFWMNEMNQFIEFEWFGRLLVLSKRITAEPVSH